MKRYSASELRQHLARVFDEVERGEPVVIERRGRRFRIVAVDPAKPPRRLKPFFRLHDPRLLEAGWGWSWKGPGRPLRFVTRRRRSRS